MDFNILIGGAAGQGMDTLTAVLERILKRKGLHVFTIRDYMSRIRGGHNFFQVRFSNRPLYSHREALDILVALNNETIDLHESRVQKDGVVICEGDFDVNSASVADDGLSDDSADGGPYRFRFPFKAEAKKTGDAKAVTMINIGIVLRLLGLDIANTEDVLMLFFSGDVLQHNIDALKTGYSAGSAGFMAVAGKTVAGKVVAEEAGAAYKAMVGNKDGSILISGNEAIALGAIAAGCMFYSAYPMTPSTSIMNYLAGKMEKAGIVVEQAEDEIAAINMAIGASFTGVRAMTGTSGGGFSLMVEGLGLAAMTETPLVIAEIQRPGPVTGFPTRTEQGDLKFILNASQGEFPRMIIAPRHPGDAFYQTARAFNLADRYQIPVFLLGDQFLADYTCTVKPFDFSRISIERHIYDCTDLPEGREYRRYALTDSGISPRIIPGKIPGQVVLADSDEHDETGHITEDAGMRALMTDKRMRKLKAIEQEIQEPEYIGADFPEILLIAWGSTYGPIMEAVERLVDEGSNVGALIFGDIWPLPVKNLYQYSDTAISVINVEQNATGQLGGIIREVTGIACHGSILKYDGRPMSGEYIYNRVKSEVLK